MKYIVLFFLGLAVLAQGQTPQLSPSVNCFIHRILKLLGLRQDEWMTAKAVLVAGSDPNVNGTTTITLRQRCTGGPVLVEGRITGLTPGDHGFHIHEKGATSNGCLDAGPHFNPYNRTHGSPTDQNRHAGDLGNIAADNNGVANFRRWDYQITLIPDQINTVRERTCVVHEKPDDLGSGGNEESLKTGNAGKRWACGIIHVTHECCN